MIRARTILLAAAVAALTATSSHATTVTCDRFGCSDWPGARAAVSTRAAKAPRMAVHGRRPRKTAVRASLPRFASRDVARGGARLGTFDCAGVPIRVATAYGQRFEAFCKDMAAAGYRAIAAFTNGYRPWGTCRGCEMHPRGLALDYDQLARDRTAVRMSRSEASRIARRHGLVSGGDWCHGDLGHFEVDVGTNAPPCRVARRHRGHRSTVASR